MLPLGSTRLDSILDVMESEEHLWTDFGLRSISKNDTFYHVGNAPGDEPYWRGPIWVNINYLALKALQVRGAPNPYPYHNPNPNPNL